jgi:cytochrome c oxidase assembly protein subunit 11
MRGPDRNDKVMLICVGIFAGMLGLTYASVPLYRIFCQTTGYNGTPRFSDHASAAMAAGEIEVRFDANVGSGLPWEFAPVNGSVRVKFGENKLAFFRAHNDSSVATAGTATFNVTPDEAGQYFNKTQCFCFTRQELKSNGSANLGVTFFVDPAIANDPETKNIRAITLSYTFYPAKAETKTAAAAIPR